MSQNSSVKMRKPMFCPACEKNNVINQLILKQINIDCAVYLCENRSCSYPEGFEWITVQRSLDKMYKENKKMKKKQKSEIKSELDTRTDCSNTFASFDDLFNIDSILEEEINKLNEDTKCSKEDFDFDSFLFGESSLPNNCESYEIGSEFSLDNVYKDGSNMLHNSTNINDAKDSNLFGLLESVHIDNKCNTMNYVPKVEILDQIIFYK